MLTTPLNSSLESEFQKGLYALKLKRFYQQRKVKNHTRALGSISILFLVAAVFNGFPILYLGIVTFLWVVFGLSNLIDAFFLSRAERRLGDDVEFSFNPSFRTSVAFDSNEVSTIVRMLPERKTTLTWKQFTGYIDSGEVLLLATTNPKLHWSFTRQEMGDEAYDTLRTLAKVKLPALKTYYDQRNEWWRFLMSGTL